MSLRARPLWCRSGRIAGAVISEGVGKIGSVTDQAGGRGELAVYVDSRHRVADCQRYDLSSLAGEEGIGADDERADLEGGKGLKAASNSAAVRSTIDGCGEVSLVNSSSEITTTAGSPCTLTCCGPISRARLTSSLKRAFASWSCQVEPTRFVFSRAIAGLLTRLTRSGGKTGFQFVLVPGSYR